MVNWDFLVGAIVLLAIVLIIWARVSNQTIAEVLADIRDLLSGGTEEVTEKAEEVIVYE